MWRATDYDEDGASGINSVPATNSRYIGAGFTPQTKYGTLLVSPDDDRVAYEAGIENDYQDQFYGSRLGADSDGVGWSSTEPGTVFPGPAFVQPQGVQGHALEPTLPLPGLGFPLPRESDEEYARRTLDYTADTTGSTIDRLTVVSDTSRYVSEKPVGILQRLSGHPAEIQPVRPWDRVTGRWPWSGDKVAMTRPIATAPLTFSSPLIDPVPSPTGTSGSDVVPYRYDLDARPLTFRVPAEPWDTANDGFYVDNGA